MTSDDRKGELFTTPKYPSERTQGRAPLYFQGGSGIVEKLHIRGPNAAEEEHVTVNWLNGNLEKGPRYGQPKKKDVDANSGHFRGLPEKRTGKAAEVKWKVAAHESLDHHGPLQKEGLPPGDEGNNWSALINEHEQWIVKETTASGWALAIDPWKETEHWLPPRRLIERRDGKQGKIDQDYCFTRVDGRYRYEVSMQQIINI
jgi:hypothetical protein